MVVTTAIPRHDVTHVDGWLDGRHATNDTVEDELMRKKGRPGAACIVPKSQWTLFNGIALAMIS